MAFTRKFLSALGIEAEKIDEIINAHVEVVEALKEERDNFKEQAERAIGLDEENKKLKEANKGDFETKYNEAIKEFEAYKKEIEAKQLNDAKAKAYRDLLAKSGVSEKRLDAVLKVTDLSSIELLEDGNLKDAETLSKTIKEEWSDFIETKKKVGANTPNPPANNGGTFESMSLSDKMKFANENPTSPEVMAWLKK